MIWECVACPIPWDTESGLESLSRPQTPLSGLNASCFGNTGRVTIKERPLNTEEAFFEHMTMMREGMRTAIESTRS